MRWDVTSIERLSVETICQHGPESSSSESLKNILLSIQNCVFTINIAYKRVYVYIHTAVGWVLHTSQGCHNECSYASEELRGSVEKSLLIPDHCRYQSLIADKESHCRLKVAVNSLIESEIVKTLTHQIHVPPMQ